MRPPRAAVLAAAALAGCGHAASNETVRAAPLDLGHPLTNEFTSAP